MTQAMTTPLNGPRFGDIVHWSNPIAKAVERLASFHGRTFTVVSYAQDTRTARVELKAEASRWKYVALAVQLTILSPLVLIAVLAKWLIVRRCQLEMVKPAGSSPTGSIVESDSDEASDVGDEGGTGSTGSAVAPSSAELELNASTFIDQAQRQAEARRAVSPTLTRRELERSTGDGFDVPDLNSRFVQRIEAPGTELAVGGDLLSSSVVATYVAQTQVVPAASGTQLVPLFSLKRDNTDPLASIGHDVVARWNSDTVFEAVATEVEREGDAALPLSAADESAAASALPEAGHALPLQEAAGSADSSPKAASSETLALAKTSSDEAEASPRPRVNVAALRGVIAQQLASNASKAATQAEATTAADEQAETPVRGRYRTGRRVKEQRLQTAARQVLQGQAGSPTFAAIVNQAQAQVQAGSPASTSKKWRVKQQAAQTPQTPQ